MVRVLIFLIIFIPEMASASTIYGYYYVIDKEIYNESMTNGQLRKLAKSYVSCMSPSSTRKIECNAHFIIDGQLSVYVLNEKGNQLCELQNVVIDGENVKYVTFFHQGKTNDQGNMNNGKYICVFKTEGRGNR